MWQLDDDKSIAASASEKLMRQVVVLPDADTFGLWLEEFPGISSDPDVGKTLRILLGMTKDTSEKKRRAVRKIFRSDDDFAVHCWGEFFRGVDSDEAAVAGAAFHRAILDISAFVDAHRKR